MSSTCRVFTKCTGTTITYVVRNGDVILHSFESYVEKRFNQYPLQCCIRCFSNNKYWIYSLNDVIAEERNNINKFVEIVLRWMTNQIPFHTGIQKIYNSVKLRQED